MNTRTGKIIFWLSTTAIFLFEGVFTAFTFQSDIAKEGIRHLGYPEYFGTLLAFFKVLGALVLIIPHIKGRVKELAYAGFVFDFLFASASITIVDGFGFAAVFPLIFLGILVISYIFYHKVIHNEKGDLCERNL